MRILAFIAALAATPAFAVDIPQPKPVAISGSTSISNASASSTAAAWARSGAVAAAEGGSAYSQGGTSQIVFNAPGSVSYDFSGGVRTVPDVYAPALAGGNPCTLSASIGGAVLGFGVSGGIGYESDNCNRRAEAALLWNMDEKRAAVMHLRVHIPEVAETFKALEAGE